VRKLQDMYKNIVEDIFPETMTITLGEQHLVYKKRTWTMDGEVKGLRYGENPDQPAALYALIEGELSFNGQKWRGLEGIVSQLSEGDMLQAGKHPGKTNLTDVDNAINILQYLTKLPAALILKHNNPCGAAWSAAGIGVALEKAFWCDRIAAFGGAVVVNRPLSMEAAKLIAANYFEVVAAPDFEEGVLELLATRKSLRILRLTALADLSNLAQRPFLDIKSLMDGGIIVQQSFLNAIRESSDFLPACASSKDGTTLTARAPSAGEADDLLFAWAIEAGVSSNSIIFAKNGATLAIGTGEQDRVGCVELAIFKAYTKYADRLSFTRHGLTLYELKLKAAKDADAAAQLEIIEVETKQAKGGLLGSVVVSDGFFPFRDGVDVCMAEGITAIAQPGGSLKDVDIIAAVNEASPQVAMVFTGQRSFKH